LSYVGEKVKKSFPELIHAEHFMSRITVKEKSLGEERQVPMTRKKSKNDYHLIEKCLNFVQIYALT